MLRGLGHPCWTAFERSSAMTIASGVTTSAGNSPAEPTRSTSVSIASSRVRAITRSATSSKSASSLLLRQRFVNHGDRAHPANGFGKRSSTCRFVDSARLQSQERRHGLQVVLDSMVDLADRRILGQQRLLLPTKVRDIANQHECTEIPGLPLQRNASQRHGRFFVLNLSRSW